MAYTWSNTSVKKKVSLSARKPICGKAYRRRNTVHFPLKCDCNLCFGALWFCLRICFLMRKKSSNCDVLARQNESYQRNDLRNEKNEPLHNAVSEAVIEI